MPDAKIIQTQFNPTKFNTVGQSGATVVSQPTAVSNGSQQGAKILGGAVSGPGGVGAGQTKVEIVATPARQRGNVPPRPGVAPRPNARAPGARVAIVPTPVKAEVALTPLTVDQGMFIMHLVESFMLAQREANHGVVAPDIQEIATGTLASINAWTGALSRGIAQTVPVAPITDTATEIQPPAAG